jgi:hypothetical protein
MNDLPKIPIEEIESICIHLKRSYKSVLLSLPKAESCWVCGAWLEQIDDWYGERTQRGMKCTNCVYLSLLPQRS